MKNRIIMTVGTSLLSSACWNIEGVDTYDGLTSESEKRLTEANNRDVLDKKADNDLISAFNDSIWESKNPLRDLPAEMATLSLLVDLINADTDQNNHLKKGDELFLLHSDNNDGSKCAKVQEKILKKLIPILSIERVPIANLDPADKSELQRALMMIKTKCEEWLQPTVPSKVFLNLTGGYKAISIVISSVATKLNRPATIVYGHESSDLAREGLYTIEFGQTSSSAAASANSLIKVGYVDNGVIHSILL